MFSFFLCALSFPSELKKETTADEVRRKRVIGNREIENSDFTHTSLGEEKSHTS